MTAPVDWRRHYAELCREGEQLRLAGAALGNYIAQRMTAAELRQMLRDHYQHTNKETTL